MSDSSAVNIRNSKEKVIKIRPIKQVAEFIPYSNSSVLDEAKRNIDQELKEAYMQLEQVKSDQNALLKEVQDKIEREKESWLKEEQNLIKKARDEGYQDGFQSGKQEGLEQYKDLLDQAKTIIDTATKDYHATLEQSETMILDLAIHTAEKIIGQKMSDQPEMFINIIKEAIKGLKEQAKIVIYLHPDNYEMVIKQKDELIRLVGNEAAISIYANEDTKKGSCIIEHPFGKIDASIDTQLEQIRECLYDVVMEQKQ